MESELFTFIICNHDAYSTQNHFCPRTVADRKFAALTEGGDKHPNSDYVAYYCASVGGLVNSWTKRPS